MLGQQVQDPTAVLVETSEHPSDVVHVGPQRLEFVGECRVPVAMSLDRRARQGVAISVSPSDRCLERVCFGSCVLDILAAAHSVAEFALQGCKLLLHVVERFRHGDACSEVAAFPWADPIEVGQGARVVDRVSRSRGLRSHLDEYSLLIADATGPE